MSVLYFVPLLVHETQAMAILLVITCNKVLYITDSVLVNLGVRSSCAIGNNELVVTRN